MKAQRIDNSEQAALIKQAEKQKKKGVDTNQKKSKVAKWKRESEQLRKIVQSVKGNGDKDNLPRNVVHVKSGVIDEEEEDDLQLCKFCGRRYSEQTYERHLPVCERKYQEKMMKQKYASNRNQPSGVNKYDLAKNYGAGINKR